MILHICLKSSPYKRLYLLFQKNEVTAYTHGMCPFKMFPLEYFL